MNVLLCGKSNNHALGASYRRAFETTGQKVVTVDTTKRSEYLDYYLRNKFLRYVTEDTFKLRKMGSKKWREYIKEKGKKSNVAFTFIIDVDFIFPETIKALRDVGAGPVFIFNSDSPLETSRSSKPEHILAAEECDLYFSFSHSLSSKLRKHGVNNVKYVPFGWDPFLFPKLGPVRKNDIKHEVVFIGSWDKQREKWLTPVAKNFDLKIWGHSYWKRAKKRSPVWRCWQGNTRLGRRAAKTIAESKVSINLLRQQNLPDGTNMRTFEIPGSGGFMASMNSSASKAIFPSSHAATYFACKEEMVSSIKYYLRNNHERRKIKENASRISKNETYEERALTIIDEYKNYIQK